MKHAGHLVASLLAGSMLSSPAWAGEAYSSWDNFDGSTEIDATRWQYMERVRLIENGALRLVQRDLGSQFSDSDRFSSYWDTHLTSPALITRCAHC